MNTPDTIAVVYKAAKSVFFMEITLAKAKNDIANNTDMSSNMAGKYIKSFCKMFDGEPYSDLLTPYATEYFLNNIRVDFGEKRYEKAISATKASINNASNASNGLKLMLLKMSDQKQEKVETDSNCISKNDDRKVGQLIKEEMERLSLSGFEFTGDDIARCCSLEWSKETLHLFYPFFVIFDDKKSVSSQTKDARGNNRYWNKVFTFGKTKVLITSQWYEKEKPLFIAWFNSITQQK